MGRGEVWEMSLEERLERVKKRIPKTVWISNGVVASARLTSFEHQESLIADVQGLINRLEDTPFIGRLY